MSPLTLAPDIERIVTDYLRAHADIVALSTRIRVTTPDDKTTSWVRVTKLSSPQVNQPDHLAENMIQCDLYAGATGGVPEVNTLERTVRAVLGTMSQATHSGGVVTRVDFLGGLRDVDGDLEPARDRVVLTALVYAHA